MDVTVLVTHRESALGRPSDRMRLLDDLGQRQNARLLEPRPDDLQADRQPVSGLAGGNRAGGARARPGPERPGRPIHGTFRTLAPGFILEVPVSLTRVSPPAPPQPPAPPRR